MWAIETTIGEKVRLKIRFYSCAEAREYCQSLNDEWLKHYRYGEDPNFPGVGIWMPVYVREEED